MQPTEDLAALNNHFALPGILDFQATPSGMIRANISTPQASATVYLQGAHLTHWQPTGHAPILFLSRRAEFAPGKPIRGGIPICFPWFGARSAGQPGPSHGFARIQDWTLAFAALAGDDLHLTFILAPTELSRSLGYDHFRLVYQLTIGSTLRVQLTVANDAASPLDFEEALHTYYAVADAQRASVTGLDGVTYLDKPDHAKPKLQHGPITFSAETDRVYLDTAAACVLHDPAGERGITAAKHDSHTTVLWNPWDNGAAKPSDLDPDEWHNFVAVETANAAKNAITLAPGTTHTMQLQVLPESFRDAYAPSVGPPDSRE